MQITLTDEQKTAIRGALVAYKQAVNQFEATSAIYSAKQDAVRGAFDALLAAATLPNPVPGGPPILLSSFRIGNKLIRMNAGAAYEDDSAPDAT